MSEKQLPKEVYDNMYRKYKNKDKHCTISVKDIAKARRIVSAVWKTFKLSPVTNKTNILDIGCGLGFISEALRELGGNVLGIDISSVAIECARETFPMGNYKCMSFEDVIKERHKFDVIWSLDFSLINTHDVFFINEQFIRPCLNLFNKNGIFILGWHSNFSGKTIYNWAHWNVKTIKKIKNISGLNGLRVAGYRSKFLSHCIVNLCRIFKKSAPIYFVLKKS